MDTPPYARERIIVAGDATRTWARRSRHSDPYSGISGAFAVERFKVVCGDLDRDADDLIAAAQRDAVNRRHVGIVASPGDRDVPGRRHHVVGRIEIEPAEARAKRRDPRMRGLCAG